MLILIAAIWDPITKKITESNNASTPAEAQALVDHLKTIGYPDAFWFESTLGLGTQYYKIDDSTTPPTAYLDQDFIDGETRASLRAERDRRLFETFPGREMTFDRARMVSLLVNRAHNGNSYTTADQVKANIVEPKIAWVNSVLERAEFLSLPANLPTGPVDANALWPAPFVVATQEPSAPPEEDGQGEQNNI